MSSGETVEGPAAEDEAPRPWGPGEPAAPQPCSGEWEAVAGPQPGQSQHSAHGRPEAESLGLETPARPGAGLLGPVSQRISCTS